MKMKNKDLTIIKVKVTEDMINKDVLITSDSDILQNMRYGEKAIVKPFKGFSKRSIEQNNLLWKIFELVAENYKHGQILGLPEKVILNTKQQVRNYVSVLTGFIDPDQTIYYQNPKNGKISINFKIRSWSFKELTNSEACEWFDKLSNKCAELLGCTQDELIEEAKLRMQTKSICIFCGRTGNQYHHMFSNSKANNKKYGSMVIDADFNKVIACEKCNPSHASPELSKDYILSEREFDSLILHQDNNKEIIEQIKDDNKRQELLEQLNSKKIINNVKEIFKGEQL